MSILVTGTIDFDPAKREEAIAAVNTAVEATLAEAGFGCRFLKFFDMPPAEVDLVAAAGLVVLGGPMNVDQTDRYPFLAREVGWIQDAIQAGLPVLGICLGSQLMAKALGAKVWAAGTKQIGWYEVRLTPAANGDRIMAGCPSPSDGMSPAARASRTTGAASAASSPEG